jgi:hypothetical protein
MSAVKAEVQHFECLCEAQSAMYPELARSGLVAYSNNSNRAITAICAVTA